MTVDELIELFEKHEDAYLEADTPDRRDLCAFNRLHALCPGSQDIVSAADHDSIWLGVSLDDLAAAASEDDVIFLIQNGVLLDESEDLVMHV